MKSTRFWTVIIGLAICAGIVMTFLAGCKKENTKGFAKTRFYLTDAPANYQQVRIDVQELSVNVDGNWIAVPLARPGIYNLLDFRNGIDTLIGTILLPAGNISQLRMVLGNANTLMADSVWYDLKTPSAQQSGLKFNFHETLLAGVTYDYLIDFDAARSIVDAGGDGKDKYLLKPVIRMYAKATSGAIKGDINPDPAVDLVYVLDASGVVVASTIPNADGTYLVGGLLPGTYSLEYHLAGINRKTISGIVVTNGVVTDQGFVNVP